MVLVTGKYRVIFDGKTVKPSPSRQAAELKIKRYLNRHTELGFYASAVWICYEESKGFNNWKDVDKKLSKPKRRVKTAALIK